MACDLLAVLDGTVADSGRMIVYVSWGMFEAPPHFSFTFIPLDQQPLTSGERYLGVGALYDRYRHPRKKEHGFHNEPATK